MSTRSIKADENNILVTEASKKRAESELSNLTSSLNTSVFTESDKSDGEKLTAQLKNQSSDYSL